MLRVKSFVSKQLVVVLVIALVVVLSVLRPSSFLTSTNIINVLVQVSCYGIVAYAMTFAIICGEFDLSVSSTFAMCTILFVDMAAKINIPAAILICLVFGLGIGALNGFLVSKMKMNAFIVTLATMMAVNGMGMTYTGGKSIAIANDIVYQIGNGRLFGIPYMVYIFFAVLIVAQVILTKTKFGRNLYATGGNVNVARTAAINVGFYKFIIFVILGVMSAFAAILYASRLGSGSALYASDLALYCVAATVIGGTKLSGGSGNAVRTLAGVLVMGLLFNGLSLLGMEANLQNIVKGGVIILVVAMDAYTAMKKES
jgi:ribose transport system permease protein